MSIAVRIEPLQTQETTASIVSTSEQINYADTEALLHKNNTEFVNPFVVLPNSKLNGNFKILPNTGYPGFISKQVSNSLGNFTGSLPYITIHIGIKPSYVLIKFSDGYPVAYDLNVSTYTSTIRVTNNTQSTIQIPVDVLTDNCDISLTINKWSKANTQAKIYQVLFVNALNRTYYLDDIDSVTFSENAFDSSLSLAAGICEQYAEISLYDRDNLIHQLADENILTMQYKVSIIRASNQEVLGTYTVANWEISGTDGDVKIICNDMSRTFSSIVVDINAGNYFVLSKALAYVFELCNVPWGYDSDATKAYCENITTIYGWVPVDTAKNVLEKLCNMGMLRIYWYINKFIVMRCFDADTNS